MPFGEFIFEVFGEFIGYVIFNFIGSSITWIFRSKGLSFIEIYKKQENGLLGFIVLLIMFTIITFITMYW